MILLSDIISNNRQKVKIATINCTAAYSQEANI